MRPTSYRIEPKDGSAFNGHQIDRSKPLKFKLNGRTIRGFEGDTILSATLAAGITSAGKHCDSPIALGQNMGLCVKLQGADDTPEYALPIERTPAVDGIDMETFGQQPLPSALGWLHSLAIEGDTTLGLDFDAKLTVPGPLTSLNIASRKTTDVVIVGGGIAGLSAALHAAQRKQNVVLVERRPFLGGDAVLFGHRSGEAAPQETIDEMVAKINTERGITVLTHAEALQLDRGKVYVHQITLVDGVPTAQALEIKAEYAVLATGAQDRLPIFGGNRLPGVVGLTSAFEMAHAYGVGRGDNATIVTNNNFAYRMAVLCADAGIPATKLMDSRIAPKSRFSEFAKAVGVRSEPGLTLFRVTKSPKAQMLFLKMSLSWDDSNESPTPTQIGALIVSGGWLKRLSLLQRIGGDVSLEDNGTLTPRNLPSNLTLAGYVAGFESNTAIVKSGGAAVDKLLGRKVNFIEDVPIDPDFESPIGDFPISCVLEDLNMPPIYLDGSSSLTCLPSTGKAGVFSGETIAQNDVVSNDRTLSLGDLVALVTLGRIGVDNFELLRRERAVQPISFGPDVKTKKMTREYEEAFPHIAPYLLDRFDKTAIIRYVENSERQFERGNLIFANSDTNDPTKALGVVIGGSTNGRSLALINEHLNTSGTQVLVKGARGHVKGTIGDIFKPDA